MEKEIIKMMRDKGFNKIKLLTLIDLGNALDKDLDEYPLFADMVEIRDNEVYIYDACNKDENGVIEQIYKLSDLPNDVVEDVKYSLVDALDIIVK